MINATIHAAFQTISPSGRHHAPVRISMTSKPANANSTNANSTIAANRKRIRRAGNLPDTAAQKTPSDVHNTASKALNT